MLDTSRHGRFGQTFAKGSNPAVYQRMVGVDDFPHHPERAFCHSIQQHAKRFFDRNFFACTGVPFPKIASTFFAEKPLLACRNTAFHYLPGTALFACRHFPLSFFSDGGILPEIYI
jgi:hypothetical protein